MDKLQKIIKYLLIIIKMGDIIQTFDLTTKFCYALGLSGCEGLIYQLFALFVFGAIGTLLFVISEKRNQIKDWGKITWINFGLIGLISIVSLIVVQLGLEIFNNLILITGDPLMETPFLLQLFLVSGYIFGGLFLISKRVKDEQNLYPSKEFTILLGRSFILIMGFIFLLFAQTAILSQLGLYENSPFSNQEGWSMWIGSIGMLVISILIILSAFTNKILRGFAKKFPRWMEKGQNGIYMIGFMIILALLAIYKDEKQIELLIFSSITFLATLIIFLLEKIWKIKILKDKKLKKTKNFELLPKVNKK